MNNTIQYCSLSINKDALNNRYLKDHKYMLIQEMMFLLSIIILNGGKNKFILYQKDKRREYYPSDERYIYTIKPLPNTELDNVCEFFRTKGNLLGHNIKVNIIQEDKDADFTVTKNLITYYLSQVKCIKYTVQYGYNKMLELTNYIKCTIFQYEKEHTLDSQFKIDIYELFLKLEELCENGEGLKEFLFSE